MSIFDHESDTNCFLNSTFSLQNDGNTSQEQTYFNERRNSSCLLFSHLNNHVMIDKIFILNKKCKQKIEDSFIRQ